MGTTKNKMPETVTAYKAPDGTLWETEPAARGHEHEVNRKKIRGMIEVCLRRSESPQDQAEDILRTLFEHRNTVVQHLREEFGEDSSGERRILQLESHLGQALFVLKTEMERNRQSNRAFMMAEDLIEKNTSLIEKTESGVRLDVW